MTLTTGSTGELELEIGGLRGRIAGEVITPGHAAYDDARGVFDLTRDQRPELIVLAARPEDVAASVLFAREAGLQIAVRSGGHSVAGHSAVDGALTIDLTGMKAVSIDAERRTARVQAGATSGDLAGPAHAYGLALSTGDTSSVGLGGLTTGGGIGWMVRKFGLAIDNLLSAQVVAADGGILTASADENPDLFWAIRGGGGNFGVITEFEFQLAQVGQVYGGALLLPATREVIRGYLDYVATAPDDLTVITNLMHAPPAPFVPEHRVGELALMIMPCWTGDIAEGERVIAPLRALAEPIADVVAPIPYPVMYNFTAEVAKPHHVAIRSMYADAISDAEIDAMIAAMERATSPMSLVQLRGLGGAMARVDRAATAFAHREHPYFLAVVGVWDDPREDQAVHRAWVESLWLEVRGAARGVYVNFLSNEGEGRIRDAYPHGAYERLAQLKKAYDPANVFRLNQNIRPAV